jgi:glutaredoxin/predicted ABC-type ATPase
VEVNDQKLLSPKAVGELQPPADYDFTESTKDNNCATADMQNHAKHFHEKESMFATSRLKLDQQYHGMYKVDRQRLQDSIVYDVIMEGLARASPWIVFSAGAMGAGKSHVVRWMSNQGYFPLPDIVKVDADSMRTYLPEWKSYIDADRWTAGELTRREAGMCVEIATDAAMHHRKNIWVDGSFRDSSWFEGVFTRIKQQFPHYRIAILYVAAGEEVIMERVHSRGSRTGRFVPEAEILDSFERVPRSVEHLRSMADFVAYIDNGGGEKGSDTEPRLLSYYNAKDGIVKFEDATCANNWSVCTERWATLPVLRQEHSSGLRDTALKMIRADNVVLFTKTFCIFCERLKTRLKALGIEYRERVLDTHTTRFVGDAPPPAPINMDISPRTMGKQWNQGKNVGSACGVGLQLELNRMTDTHTVPKLFVGGAHVNHEFITDQELLAKAIGIGRSAGADAAAVPGGTKPASPRAMI